MRARGSRSASRSRWPAAASWKGCCSGVTASDPRILIAVIAVIAGATLAACYIPVRRAVRVDPMVALRAE